MAFQRFQVEKSAIKGPKSITCHIESSITIIYYFPASIRSILKVFVVTKQDIKNHIFASQRVNIHIKISHTKGI